MSTEIFDFLLFIAFDTLFSFIFIFLLLRGIVYCVLIFLEFFHGIFPFDSYLWNFEVFLKITQRNS